MGKHGYTIHFKFGLAALQNLSQQTNRVEREAVLTAELKETLKWFTLAAKNITESKIKLPKQTTTFMTKHREEIQRLADPSIDEEMKCKIILKPGAGGFLGGVIIRSLLRWDGSKTARKFGDRHPRKRATRKKKSPKSTSKKTSSKKKPVRMIEEKMTVKMISYPLKHPPRKNLPRKKSLKKKSQRKSTPKKKSSKERTPKKKIFKKAYFTTAWSINFVPDFTPKYFTHGSIYESKFISNFFTQKFDSRSTRSRLEWTKYFKSFWNS